MVLFDRAARTSNPFATRTRGRGRVALLGCTALIGLGFVSSANAQDLPAGGTVTSGTATISGGGGAVTVDQSSAKAIVNWTSFDVAAGKSVIFRQPDAQSATLNRVTGGTTSTIAGQIIANGAVYLINPNGIAITAAGSVQTGGGFIASTLDIADGDFNAGKLAFAGTGTSKSVSNAGSITAGAGGYVALLGGQVSNSGTISVPMGKVALGAGETITLDLNGDGFLQVAVPGALVADGTATGDRVAMKVGTVRDAVRGIVNVPGSFAADSAVGSDGSITLGDTLGGMPRTDSAQVEATSFAAAPASDASVSNSGFIGASGGTVALTSAGALSHTGKIVTDNANGDGGRIVLLGDSVVASGKLRAGATGATGNGGFIETSGNSIDFTGLKVDTTSVGGTTGTWLIDPVDLTIDAAAATTISTNLATGNVTVQTTASTATSPGVQSGTNGDIFVNSGISWTSANTLSISSYRNIALNAAITGTSGGLTLTAGNGVANSGAITATGAVNIGIFNLTNGNWNQLTASLPAFAATDFRFFPGSASFLRATGGTGASGTPYTIADTYGLQGIASSSLLGNSFLIANNIDASATAAWNAGLGFIPIGTNGVGGVFGSGFTGTIDGGNFAINGLTIARPSASFVALVGYAAGGAVLKNIGLTNVRINAGAFSAGLLGRTVGGTAVSLSNDYVTGSIVGANGIGGLAGFMQTGSITNSFSTASVTGTNSVGGLIGSAYGAITNSYATGAVTGTGVYIGGLAGDVSSSANINNVYATGNVAGLDNVGGLFGYQFGSAVAQVYATGSVTGRNNVGGLVGLQDAGSIVSAYATGAVSGSSLVGGLIGSGSSLTKAYWDSYSTGRSGAFGNGTAVGTVTAVTSDPTQSAAANYAYTSTAYANLTAGTAIGTTAPTGFVFMPGNSTRPFLAFEVPTSALLRTSGGALVLTNSHQLQLIGYDATRLGGSYLLNNSIDFTETGRVVAGTPGSYSGMWAGTGFVPIGTDGGSNILNATGFTGSLNGGNFVVNNLTIKRSTAQYVGLIGFMNSATAAIRNIGLVGGLVTGGNRTGALIGDLFNGTVSYVYATTSVSSTGPYTGGLVGLQESTSSISNAYATGSVSSTGISTGGLVGHLGGGSINNSYATGTVAGGQYAGGLVGYEGAATSVTSSYATGLTSGTANVGGLAGFTNGTLSNSYWDMYSTRQDQASGSAANVAGATAVTSDPGQSGAATYAFKASAYANLPAASGIGTATPSGFVYLPGDTTRPFLAFEVPTSATTPTTAGKLVLVNSHQLQLVGYDATRLAGSYLLGGSIDLSETGRAVVGTPGSYSGMWAGTGWVPIGTDGAGNIINTNGFTGSFNGGNFTLSNLVINRPTVYVGLFGFMNNPNSSLSNFGLIGGTVRGLQFVGALGGQFVSGKISNIFATTNVFGDTEVGGLYGFHSNGTVTNVYAAGSVSANFGIVGGLAGEEGGTLSNAYATGAVSSFNAYNGGLVGYSNGTLRNVYATGLVSGGQYIGGLVGYQNAGTITSAYATGRVIGSANVGGLVGLSGTITNAYWDSYSTGQAQASGSVANVSGATAVTSDPVQPTPANYAYKSTAYANLTAATGIGTASPTGFVFAAGNTTRPFLAFEVPTAALAGTNASGQVLVTNAHQLQLIGYNAATNAASYALTGNIDLSETGAVTVGTPASYAGMWSGAGFVPLGTDGAGNVWNGSNYVLLSTIASGAAHGVSGSLDGGGYTLSNLKIVRGTAKNVGLFGVTQGALSNVTVGGTVTGLNGVGGLVGLLYTGGTVSGASSTATVTGTNLVGGLVGNATDGSSITRSNASGTITGTGDVGGLVGYTSGATISRSFATGNVTAASYAGGLIGYQYNSSTSNSYATGTVNATYATAGGLIGYQYGGSLLNSYAANQVTSPGIKGGLIGQLTNGGTVSSSYWDTTVSGLATSAGGTGRTTAQLQDPINYGTLYAGWNFTTIWLPPTTGNYPKLR